jgi:hypothetical protein
MKPEFSGKNFGKKFQISNFMKIRPMGAEWFHEDRQTDMPKLTITFPNFGNEPEHETKCSLKNKLPIIVISEQEGKISVDDENYSYDCGGNTSINRSLLWLILYLNSTRQAPNTGSISYRQTEHRAAVDLGNYVVRSTASSTPCFLTGRS